MSSTEPIDIDSPEVDGDQAGRITYRGELYTGQAIEMDLQGNRIALMTYTDGVQDGPERQWFSSGQQRLDGVVKYGSPVGEWREWFADGRLKRISVFDDQGEYVSVRIWDENGTLVEDEQYQS